MVALYRSRSAETTGSGYTPPAEVHTIGLRDLLARVRRRSLAEKQFDLLRPGDGNAGAPDVLVYYAGNLTLLDGPCVSIVGTREVSADGRARARRLARELTNAGVVVVSGLAKGVDTAAHTSAIESGGSTVAVIGTPINKAYPAENADLQETIYADHLLLTPFRIGEATTRASFPKRNRVMAAVSDATVIVEASDTSGTLHQAAECDRLGRWLFIMRTVAEDPNLTWPAKFLKRPKVAVLRSTAELVDAIAR
jgi:DNA processing protein